MKVGDKIHYTGDMANSEDFGVITKVYSDRWGDFVDTLLDDGRKQKRIYQSMFDKGSGQRFKTIEQYNQERAKALAKFTKRR